MPKETRLHKNKNILRDINFLLQNSNSKIDVIVLMAGEGRRLLPLTKDRPKALLCYKDGVCIFEHLVREVMAQNWEATIIPVMGHGSAKVLEMLTRLNGLAIFDSVYNPFYALLGPLVSLWLGLEQSKNDMVIILNGDTLIKESLAVRAAHWINNPVENEDKLQLGICVTKTDNFEPDDMKILLDDTGNFVRAAKDIIPKPGVLKSAGVICIRDSLSKKALKEKIDHLLTQGICVKQNYYWHNILNEINGAFKVDLIEVQSGSWYEVDTLIDFRSLNSV